MKIIKHTKWMFVFFSIISVLFCHIYLWHQVLDYCLALKYKINYFKITSRTEEEGEQWFQAKVQEVDKEKRQVLVHYMQWNSRHDEWVASNSPRLRPLRSSARLDTNTNTNGTASTPLPTTPPNNVASIELAKDFKVGDKASKILKRNRFKLVWSCLDMSFVADLFNLVNCATTDSSFCSPHLFSVGTDFWKPFSGWGKINALRVSKRKSQKSPKYIVSVIF